MMDIDATGEWVKSDTLDKLQDRIAVLEADKAKLRDALAEIAKGDADFVDRLEAIARAALKEDAIAAALRARGET